MISKRSAVANYLAADYLAIPTPTAILAATVAGGKRGGGSLAEAISQRLAIPSQSHPIKVAIGLPFLLTHTR